MASVIERADQLVLEYVSRVADAAHGRLRPEQRLDFSRRLRERVEEERAGSEDPRHVMKVIARFGPPGELIDREVRRLAAIEQAGQISAAGTAETPPAPEGATAVFPVIVDDAEPRTPSGVTYGRRLVSRRLSRGGDGRAPFGWLRRAAMARANPMATGGRDARTILLNNRRETVAILLLVLAGLLVPFRLPSVQIFPVPMLVWAAGALTVLACEGWAYNDRLIGLGAPVAAYLVGGAMLGAVRTEGDDIPSFLAAFHSVSGVMFILGTAAGVFWLVYRLLDPPQPPHRSGPVTRR